MLANNYAAQTVKTKINWSNEGKISLAI